MGSIPTVAVVGKAGRLIINESDLKMYEQQGYKLESALDPADDETLEEAIDKCRSKKALKKLVEEQEIEVEFEDGAALPEMKEVALEALED